MIHEMSECPICKDEMDTEEYLLNGVDTEKTYRAPCGHAYHAKCLIGLSNKCPLCNGQLRILDPPRQNQMQLAPDTYISAIDGHVCRFDDPNILLNPFACSYYDWVSRGRMECICWCIGATLQFTSNVDRDYSYSTLCCIAPTFNIQSKINHREVQLCTPLGICDCKSNNCTYCYIFNCPFKINICRFCVGLCLGCVYRN